MSGRRKSATGAAGSVAVAAAGSTLFIGLVVTGAPLGRAQLAEEELERLAQAKPEPDEALQVQEDAWDVDVQPGVDVDIFAGGGGTASELVHVPVVNLFPGAVPVRPSVANPVADDPAAAQRGMEYFNQMNCVGCPAPNGAGGMGPSLSNATFLYGHEHENIYLSILQGRPNGMPAWGRMLPDQVIWDLVAYIESISREPTPPWAVSPSPRWRSPARSPGRWSSWGRSTNLPKSPASRSRSPASSGGGRCATSATILH
jgi:cytochrome c oxidase cbb3-type subunit III